MKHLTKQKLYRLKNFLRGKAWYYSIDKKLDLLTAGDSSFEWTFYPDYLSPESIVYTFGVGNNISFEVSLVTEFGVKVFLFDPTPGSIKYIQNNNLSTQYIFEPIGISDFDGRANLYFPPDDRLHSCSLIPTTDNKGFTEVNVERLSTIMNRNRHSCIDILKMDIEGAEYAVIRDIIDSGINIKQLLVEFHHRFPEYSIKMTNNALRLLRSHGYKLVNVSATGEEFTLINENTE